MIKAALIDMDGFLVNSEELYLEANKVYFKKLGFEFTEDLHRQGMGKKFDDRWIKTVFTFDKSKEEIFRERNVILFDLVRSRLELLDGARKLLTILHNNFKTALVTSSNRDYIDLVFSKTGISNFFDIVVTGEMITHGKPNPECYKFAAQKLGVNPSECIVFEDSPSGVLSGKAAGMKVIAVPNQFVKGDTTFSKADLVVGSLKEITLEKIRSCCKNGQTVT